MRPTWTCAASRRPRPARATSSSAPASRWAGCTPCTGRSCSPARPAACGACRSYDRLAAAGAVFGEAAGWERAVWYARPGERPEYEYSFGRQNWFGAVAEEHRAAREGVALFDLSSFAKLRVEGPDALATVQRVFTADLDRPPGSVVYTSMLNPRGGLELDATVTRLGERRVPRRHVGDGADQGVPLAAPPRATRAPSSPTSPPASACSR